MWVVLLVLLVTVSCRSLRDRDVAAVKGPDVENRGTYSNQSDARPRTEAHFVRSKGFVEKAVDDLRISFLNVGSGACQLVQCPGDETSILVDCGSSGGRSHEDMTFEQAADYLRDEVGDRLIVVLSHPDDDHTLWVPEIFPAEEYKVESIWIGGDIDAYSPSVRRWIEKQVDFRDAEVQEGFPPGFDNEGEPIRDFACGPVETYILTVNVGSTSNDQSLVLMFEYSGKSPGSGNRIVLTGDATGKTQKRMVAELADKIDRTEVLVACHHGAATHGSNDKRWVAAVQPEMVIYNAGLTRGLFHPRCSVTELYGEYTLADTPPHKFWCGEGDTWIIGETESRQYITEDNGRLELDVSGNGAIQLRCSVDHNCW